jgi:Transposase
MGISSSISYKWRAKFGGMDTSMMSRMKELEDENRRLTKMYMEEKLHGEIASEALAKKGWLPTAKVSAQILWLRRRLREMRIGADTKQASSTCC